MPITAFIDTLSLREKSTAFGFYAYFYMAEIMEKVSRIIEVLCKDPARTMLALKISILIAALLIGVLAGDPIEDDGL